MLAGNPAKRRSNVRDCARRRPTAPRSVIRHLQWRRGQARGCRAFDGRPAQVCELRQRAPGRSGDSRGCRAFRRREGVGRTAQSARHRRISLVLPLVRDAIVDRHGRGRSEANGLQRWEVDPTARSIQPEPRRVCGCVRAAMEKLDPSLQAALEAVEIRGLAPRAFAAEVRISPGNASVRLHRARRRLADELRAICGSCTLDGCSDCDCGHSRQM